MNPTPEDFHEAAEEALEQAKTLAGMGTMSDREFLESMARCDRLVDHEDNCGHCGMQIIHAQTAPTCWPRATSSTASRSGRSSRAGAGRKRNTSSSTRRKRPRAAIPRKPLRNAAGRCRGEPTSCPR